MRKLLFVGFIALLLPLTANAGFSFGLVKAAKKTGDKVDEKVAQKKEEIRIANTNSVPLLSWTGEANYYASGVSPVTGTSTMTFTFRIKYSDTNGDAPNTGYPKLHVKKSGLEISGSPFTMSYVSGDYSTGVIYSASVALTPSSGYAYNFEAQDYRGGVATGTPTAQVSAPHVAGWITQSIETLNDAAASIQIASNNYPHIAYEDRGSHDLKYAMFNGVSWSTQTVENCGSNDTSLRPSIALDSTGNPRIAYEKHNGLSTTDYKYAKWNGATWAIQIFDSSSNITAWAYPSLALDSADNPHIGYNYGGSGTSLKYATWTTTWSTATVDASMYSSRNPALALGPNDYPQISYRDETNQDLRYAKWTGAAWTIQTIDSSGNVGYDTAIAVDSNNYPHIAYFDGSNGSLKYAKWNGSSWQITTVYTASSGGGVAFTSIALDSLGYPHIAAWASPVNKLVYAKWDGATWTTELISEITSLFPAIAVDSADMPHLVGIGGGELRHMTWQP